MSEDRLREIFAESGHDFTADAVPGLTLDDLNESSVEAFRQRWMAKAAKAEDPLLVERLRSLSLEQLLEDAEAMTDGRLTYASLILFGKPAAVSSHLAAAEIVFEFRSSDASGPAQDRKEFREAFFGCYDVTVHRGRTDRALK